MSGRYEKEQEFERKIENIVKCPTEDIRIG